MAKDVSRGALRDLLMDGEFKEGRRFGYDDNHNPVIEPEGLPGYKITIDRNVERLGYDDNHKLVYRISDDHQITTP